MLTVFAWESGLRIKTWYGNRCVRNMVVIGKLSAGEHGNSLIGPLGRLGRLCRRFQKLANLAGNGMTTRIRRGSKHSELLRMPACFPGTTVTSLRWVPVDSKGEQSLANSIPSRVSELNHLGLELRIEFSLRDGVEEGVSS